MQPGNFALPALFLLLAASAAQAQMYKCVDERGRLSYQEQPCAGTKPLPPPKSDAAQGRKAGAAPQATEVRAAPVDKAAGLAQLTDMTFCADQWESEAMSRDRSRRWEADQAAAGRKGVPESFQLKRDQNVMVRFLPKCEKYGFGWPPILPVDSAGEARNARALEDLRRKITALREVVFPPSGQ